MYKKITSKRTNGTRKKVKHHLACILSVYLCFRKSCRRGKCRYCLLNVDTAYECGQELYSIDIIFFFKS